MRDYTTPRYSFAQTGFGDSFIPLELDHGLGTQYQVGRGAGDFRDADFSRKFSAPDDAYASTGHFKCALGYRLSFDSGVTAGSDLPRGNASRLFSPERYVATGAAEASSAVAPKVPVSIAVAQAQGTYRGAIVFDFSFDHTGSDERGDGVLQGAYGSRDTALDASAPAPFETLSLAQMLTQILLNSGTNTAAIDQPINWSDFAQALAVFSGHAVHASPT